MLLVVYIIASLILEDALAHTERAPVSAHFYFFNNTESAMCIPYWYVQLGALSDVFEFRDEAGAVHEYNIHIDHDGIEGEPSWIMIAPSSSVGIDLRLPLSRNFIAAERIEAVRWEYFYISCDLLISSNFALYGEDFDLAIRHQMTDWAQIE